MTKLRLRGLTAADLKYIATYPKWDRGLAISRITQLKLWEAKNNKEV